LLKKEVARNGQMSDCGKETKSPIKEWDLSKIHVKLYECCGKKFREYVKII
jgi:hypothetical protein